MNFKIRKAKQSDAKDLARLYIQFWEAHKKVDPLLEFNKKITLKNQIEFAKKDIRKRNTITLVADLNGRIIGFIEFFIKKNEPCFKIKEYGYLNAATTHKEFRGKGVMKELTKAATKMLREKRIKYIKTNVYNSNDAAMKTWIKSGFKPQSTLLIKSIK